jgi:hypothetical protein
MASTSVDGTMYIVVPTAANIPLSAPTIVNTLTSVNGANGGLVILTPSTVLPAGSYLVGGSFSATATAGNAWGNSDNFTFRIYDTAGSLTNYPQAILTGYSQSGSGPYGIAVTVTGILTLATAGTLTWGVTVSEASQTGKVFTLGNAYYQRVA